MDAQSDRPETGKNLDTVSVLARIGNAAFAATLAAALSSLPAAVRIAEAGQSFVMAWSLLGAIALVPMAALVPIFRAAREGLRAFDGEGARERIGGFALWAGAVAVVLARFAAILRAKTHHHALAGVTFAIGAIVAAVVLGLFALRAVRWARRGGVAHAAVAGLAAVVITVLLVQSVPAGLSPSARAAAIDGTAAMVALLVSASRTLEARRNLTVLGGPIAALFVILALFSSHELRLAVSIAPLHDALTRILSALP